jgi:predicted dehydrogenase
MPQPSGGARLRCGLVGCGAVTERYHLPALAASAEVEVTAVVDPVLERARALAGRVGARLVLSDHATLPGAVDLAIVAAPNAVHASIAIDLLSAGVHVLVEKPMARTTAECDGMIAAAERSGVVLAVGHDFRYFPVARFAHDWFAAAVVGELRRVDVRQSAGGRWPYASSAALSPQAGGGVLIDFGVHLFDLLLWWFGEIRVRRYGDDAAGGIETECEAELALVDGDVPVRLDLSRSRRLRDTIVVEGERATVEIGVFEPAVFRLTLPGRPNGLTGHVPDPGFESAPLPTVFARQLSDVVAAIRGASPPAAGGVEGRRAVALVEACYACREPLRHPWDYPEAYTGVGRSAP